MAISRFSSSGFVPAGVLFLGLLFLSAVAWSREAASPSACQLAAVQPEISAAKTALDRDPSDLKAHFALADAWSDAGCFNEAVQVLQSAQAQHPESKELQTRLRVAKSLVGEEHYFDNIDRADTEAKLKRDVFRCTTLADLDACNEGLRLKPDDPDLLIAQGDALVRARRPADALNRYRLAAVIAPNQHDVAAKISTIEAQVTVANPSSAAPGTSSGAATVQRAGALPRQRSVAAKPATEPPLRAALGAPAAPGRHYTNAAPETQSH